MRRCQCQSSARCSQLHVAADGETRHSHAVWQHCRRMQASQKLAQSLNENLTSASDGQLDIHKGTCDGDGNGGGFRLRLGLAGAL